ncbi:MAG: alpha/beta hydrolase [Deferrisomatales bacterium]|nr:alpha/beta hydrolase [Deferrisomatales bacterium]
MSSDAGGVRSLPLPDGTCLAYCAQPGAEPTVVFLGGFTSDMTGTKALALGEHCRRRGRAYVRFDYFGHGASEGRFRDATLGRWLEDALAVMDEVARGPVVLVGSSMGGWLMVRAALARPERVRGLVGVAAAPDFTEELIEPALDANARRSLAEGGVVWLPNPYGTEPTPVTASFLGEARRHRVLGGPIGLWCPVRLLHGLADREVPWQLSLRLAEALEGGDVTLTLVKGGGHRLSEPGDLARLFVAVDDVCGAPGPAAGGGPT